MASLMLLPIITTLVCREPAQPEVRIQRRIDFFGAFWQPIASFFSTNGVVLAVVLLAFVGLFKFPDQVIGVMAGPFYLDSGFTKADIATVSKLFGVWMGIGGAFLGGIAVAAFGFRRMLLVAALGVALSNLAFLLMAQNPGQLCRHRAGGIHVLADRPQLHRHPVRPAGVAGQPARQVRRWRLGVHRRGHLLQHLLHPELGHGHPDPAAAGLAVAPHPRPQRCLTEQARGCRAAYSGPSSNPLCRGGGALPTGETHG